MFDFILNFFNPKHLLPQSLSDFQKKTSVIRCSKTGAEALSEIAADLAEHEGLSAHAASAVCRGTKP